MFRFEIPRNVRTVRGFLGLTFQGWLWTAAVSSIIGSVTYLITENPLITMGSMVFVYYLIRVTSEVNEQTGDKKIDVILEGFEVSKNKKLSIRWGDDQSYEKTAIRTTVKGK